VTKAEAGPAISAWPPGVHQRWRRRAGAVTAQCRARDRWWPGGSTAPETGAQHAVREIW